MDRNGNTTMTQSLRDMVFENLDNGLENEPDIVNWTVLDIAIDLTAYAADLEDYKAMDLVPYVKEWLEARRAK